MARERIRVQRATAAVTRERIRAQVGLWHIWNQQRVQEREERRNELREWSRWSELPPEPNSIPPYPEQPPKLSQEQVYSLAEVYTGREKIECPICISEIEFDDIIIALRCYPKPHPKHIICLGCSLKWMCEQFGSCPCCKTPVKVDN